MLDGGFGTGGVVTTAIGTSHDTCYAVARQEDGKLVAAGSTYGAANYDFALVRYRPGGSLDPSFGAGGKVVTSISDDGDYGRDVAIQADGKIVLVGFSYSGSDTSFAVARYETDGDLDPTFGSGGIVTTTVGSGYSEAHAVVLMGEKIVVGGYSEVGGSTDFTLVRYDTSGAPDPTFGTNGIVTTDFGSEDIVYDLAIDDAGRIVAVGENVSYYMALARYRPEGPLDPSFGRADGRVNADLGTNSTANAVALQPDGRIVIVGAASSGLLNRDMAVVRYGRDLVMHKTASRGPGDTIAYTLAFSNTGAMAGGVSIMDHLPPNVSVVSVVNHGVPITPVLTTPPVYKWTVGKLAYGQGGAIVIRGSAPIPPAALTFTNTAIIDTADWDSDPSNDISDAVLTLRPPGLYLPLVVKS
jgi:uncharacterized delta-60 repeat protein/uncharacterized repeat protein (TIGR01451 family)